MIKCCECVLEKTRDNCKSCRNMTGKLYLDFLVEVRELAFNTKRKEKARIYAVQDSIVLEESMINSFSPNLLKEAFSNVNKIS